MTDRVALVAGATSDIGSAIAQALSRRGLAVAVHFHSDAERAGVLADELVAMGGRAAAWGADTSSMESVRDLVEAVTEEFGGPAVMVNAVSDARFERFLDSDPALWRRQIEVTLIGAMNLMRVCAEQMVRKKDGRLISILAEGALVGEPALAVASASKGGILGLTRSLAKDLAAHGITVNAVSPGFIPTRAVPERFRTAERLASIAEHYPAGRLGTADDIAEVTAFLASPEASYVTGQTISVSGGYSVR